jgi:hypothetical protein
LTQVSNFSRACEDLIHVSTSAIAPETLSAAANLIISPQGKAV